MHDYNINFDYTENKSQSSVIPLLKSHFHTPGYVASILSKQKLIVG